MMANLDKYSSKSENKFQIFAGSFLFIVLIFELKIFRKFKIFSKANKYEHIYNRSK